MAGRSEPSKPNSCIYLRSPRWASCFTPTYKSTSLSDPLTWKKTVP